ncbi:hypothetical protein V6N13_123530 [Hibiscus sabdariffa]
MCSREFKNINLTSKTIDKKYLHLFVADRNLKLAALREAVMHDYVFPVPQSKCYRAREMALEIIVGKHKSQYSRLYDYIAELRLSNPGTTTFLELLAEDLGLTNSYHVSFMTDKQKGLLDTLAKLFPHSESRTCVRHMYMNFKLKFTGKALKDALWKVARATYMREYEFILEARDKPIITLLEIIRTKIMQRIAKKKVEADKWTTTLCPKIQQKLVASIERSNRCWTTHAGHFKYQVACGPHTQHAVNVEKHTCSCRIWQLTGIPCNHAVSAIFATDRIPDEFVDQCYKHPHNKKYTAIWFNLLEVKINGLQMRLAPHLTSNPEMTPWHT